MKLDQSKAPVLEALERMKTQRLVPFDVPGHKRGKGNPDLTAFLGEKCLSVDVNSMKMLDNLCHPVSVIKEAEELAADAFGAAMLFSWWEELHLRYRVWSCLSVSVGRRLFCLEMYIEV